MILCFDTETTGFNPSEGAEVIQLSMKQCDGDFIYDEYFCPVNSTSFPTASNINHLYYDEPVPGRDVLLRDCPTLSTPEIHNYIQSIFDACGIIVGYNLQYDLKMLEASGFEFNGIVMNDAMLDHRDYLISDACPECEANRAELWADWIKPNGGYKSVKLVNAATYYGYSDSYKTKAHNSMADVEATIFVWEKLRERGYVQDRTRAELAMMP